MPELSRFYGIVITMYRETGQHTLPHFHARYGGTRASFSIEPVELLAGELPRRQMRLVLAWAELHVDELQQAWQALQNDEQADKIAGL